MYLYKLLIMQKLLKAKAHLGSSFASSDTQHYIYGFRNNIAIIDLEKTLICLRRACNIIELIIRSKGHLLFVNSDPEYNKIVKQTAILSNQSFINHKWIGGFLTNWIHMQNVQQHFNLAQFPNDKLLISRCAPLNKTVLTSTNNTLNNSSKRACVAYNDRSYDSKQMNLNTKERSGGRFTASSLNVRSTFEERLLLKQPRQRSFEARSVGAQRRCEARTFTASRPDCVIIFNANHNPTAIHEASLLQIPIISLVDSNISNQLHSLITYPIPVNTASIELIYLVSNCFLKTILSSRR